MRGGGGGLFFTVNGGRRRGFMAGTHGLNTCLRREMDKVV